MKLLIPMALLLAIGHAKHSITLEATSVLTEIHSQLEEIFLPLKFFDKTTITEYSYDYCYGNLDDESLTECRQSREIPLPKLDDPEGPEIAVTDLDSSLAEDVRAEGMHRGLVAHKTITFTTTVPFPTKFPIDLPCLPHQLKYPKCVSQEEEEEEEEQSPIPHMKKKPIPQEEKLPSLQEEKPSSLQEEKPPSPQEEKPTSPQEEKPTSPQEENPASPQEENPASPQEENPASPQEENPASPQEEQPSSPQEEKPSNPGVEM